ncbi:MAG TPA: hypothetical protein VNG33_01950, partial [Polyangiaceae bacterium]|nr:hypothetical protein [Polyangiaceae bacterium]
MREPRWDALGKKVEPVWGPERERSALVGIERRTTRRRVWVRVGASALALALIGGVGAFVRLRSHAPVSVASLSPAAPSPASEVATVTVLQLSPDTVLEPMPERHGRGFTLRAGGARFTVQHDTAHPLVVAVGDISIEDIG